MLMQSSTTAANPATSHSTQPKTHPTPTPMVAAAITSQPAGVTTCPTHSTAVSSPRGRAGRPTSAASRPRTSGPRETVVTRVRAVAPDAGSSAGQARVGVGRHTASR